MYSNRKRYNLYIQVPFRGKSWQESTIEPNVLALTHGGEGIRLGHSTRSAFYAQCKRLDPFNRLATNEQPPLTTSSGYIKACGMWCWKLGSLADSFWKWYTHRISLNKRIRINISPGWDLLAYSTCYRPRQIPILVLTVVIGWYWVLYRLKHLAGDHWTAYIEANPLFPCCDFAHM